jgi:Zn-dependent peptidase ImmA (M78 family)
MLGKTDNKKAIEVMLSVPKQGGLEGDREMQEAPKNVGIEICVKDLLNAIQDKDHSRFLEAHKVLHYLIDEELEGKDEPEESEEESSEEE